MEFDKLAIGTDIEEIERFEGKNLDSDKKFLERIFTPNELEYCFSKSNPAQHLCARYCAKEAVVKAISLYGIKDTYYSDIEVLNCENGTPLCKINKYPDIEIKISLSHSKKYATANVLCYGTNISK